jgi:hypothetical protein
MRSQILPVKDGCYDLLRIVPAAVSSVNSPLPKCSKIAARLMIKTKVPELKKEKKRPLSLKAFRKEKNETFSFP